MNICSRTNSWEQVNARRMQILLLVTNVPAAYSY